MKNNSKSFKRDGMEEGLKRLGVSQKLNDPIIGHPAMKGRRWTIDYGFSSGKTFSKIKESLNFKDYFSEILLEAGYEYWERHAKNMLIKLRELKKLRINKIKIKKDQVVTKSELNTAILALGKNFPKLTRELLSYKDYVFDYKELAKKGLW